MHRRSGCFLRLLPFLSGIHDLWLLYYVLWEVHLFCLFGETLQCSIDLRLHPLLDIHWGRFSSFIAHGSRQLICHRTRTTLFQFSLPHIFLVIQGGRSSRSELLPFRVLSRSLYPCLVCKQYRCIRCLSSVFVPKNAVCLMIPSDFS
jgi:hypothetical protein